MRSLRLLFLLILLVTALSARAGAEIQADSRSVQNSRQTVIDHLKQSGLGLPDKEDKGALGRWGMSSQPALESSGFKLFWALGLCLGVLLVGLYFVKRYLPGAVVPHTRRLRVVDRLSLSPKTSLVMVDVEGQKLLLTAQLLMHGLN